MKDGSGRLLSERAIEGGAVASGDGAASLRPRRSVTVNIVESPLGWLFARGFVSQRQFDAGERLRWDWERAELAPRVTMAWDSAPIARGRGGSVQQLWRVVCAGEGMREAETALGWPARAGKLVLTFALDRVADYYRIR